VAPLRKSATSLRKGAASLRKGAEAAMQKQITNSPSTTHVSPTEQERIRTFLMSRSCRCLSVMRLRLDCHMRMSTSSSSSAPALFDATSLPRRPLRAA
jgi:hypothetical protein